MVVPFSMGGGYHFLSAFHGGTILRRGGTIFLGVKKLSDEVDRLNEKCDLRSPLGRIIVALNTDQTAFFEAFKQGKRVAVGYVASGDNLPARYFEPFPGRGLAGDEFQDTPFGALHSV
jgi:hypothetical protein